MFVPCVVPLWVRLVVNLFYVYRLVLVLIIYLFHGFIVGRYTASQV